MSYHPGDGECRFSSVEGYHLVLLKTFSAAKGVLYCIGCSVLWDILSVLCVKDNVQYCEGYLVLYRVFSTVVIPSVL